MGSAQALYFHLAMHGDDDGFITNPRAIMRTVGAKDDDMKILAAKAFIIPFDSGVIVIRHWHQLNYLRKDRYTKSACAEAESLTCVNGVYELVYQPATIGIPSVDQPATQYRVDKNSIDKSREEEISIEQPSYPYTPDNTVTPPATEYDPLTAYTTKMLGPNPLMLDRLLAYRDSLPDDIIRYAVDESLKLEAAKRYSYAIKVCERIAKEGLSTLEQVKAAAEAHKREKSRPRIIRDDDYYDNSGELQ